MTLDLTICRAVEVAGLVRAAEAAGVPFHAVISFEHPCDETVTQEQGRAPRLADEIGGDWSERQKILVCWDIEKDVSTEARAPGAEILQAAMAHAEKYRPVEGPMRLLVHCRQGRSRSTAMALVLKCAFEPELSEAEAMIAVLALRPIAAFNMAMIEKGDALLGRRGRLIAAVANDAGVTARRRESDVSRANDIERRAAARQVKPALG